jgi:hypothetical protein
MAATAFVSEWAREMEQSSEWHAQLHADSRFKGMKLRKRHRIVLLFWVPFLTLAAVTTALAGWAYRVFHY